MLSTVLIYRYMNDVQFHDETDESRKNNDNQGPFTKFLIDKGLSEEQAQKVLYGVAIGAFVLSLYFWF